MTNTHVPHVVPDEDMHGINIIYPNAEGEGSHVAYFLQLPEVVNKDAVANVAADLITRCYEAGKADAQAEAPITEMPDVEVLRRENAALREEVQAQAQEVTRVTAEYSSARQSREAWMNDFSIVAQALLEEAERRDWCSEYDDFVGRLNGQLRNGELLVRAFDVDGEINVKFRFTRSYNDASAEDTLNHLGEAIANYLSNHHSEYYDWDVHSVEETRSEG